MGLGDVEIPDSLPEDVAPSIQFFPITGEEMRSNGFLYFVILKAVIEQPPGGQRTVGGLFKIAWAHSRLIQSMRATDEKRAQGVVIGLIRMIESQGLIRCTPPIDKETIWNPAMALTSVDAAGLLLDPSVRKFLLVNAYGCILWAAKSELSHAMLIRLFPAK